MQPKPLAARHTCTVGAPASGTATKFAIGIFAADASAAAPSQSLNGASRVSVTQLLTDLRLFDPNGALQGHTSSVSAGSKAGSRAPLTAGVGHAGHHPDGKLGATSLCSASSGQLISGSSCSRSFSSSASRWQDDTAATSSGSGSAPPANLNPLQAAPGAIQNPLSAAVPTATGPPRDCVAQAILRDARISPQKLDDFVRIVRRLHVDEALVQCEVSIKKAARFVHKLLQSARANGTNNHGLDGSRLYVDRAVVTKAAMQKRTALHARGKTGVIHKRRSHLTIVLRELETGTTAPRRVTRIIRPLLQRHRQLPAASSSGGS